MNKDWVPLRATVSLVNNPMQQSDDTEPRETIDTIYADREGVPAPFVFDHSVANVFPNMIRRSVPGYGASLDLIAMCAEQFGRANTHFYDLGCSRGAAIAAMLKRKPTDTVVIGVDTSPDMLQIARSELHGHIQRGEVRLHEADITDYPIENASLVAMNYTLQFISEQVRRPLLQRIYDGLVDGGALVLSEKVICDEHTQPIFEALHLAFKRDQGYSELEIAQKREALLNVLIPESIEQHLARVGDLGFTATLLAKSINFCTFLAVKP